MTVKKGTRSNDTLNGGSGADRLYGYLGNDRLTGLAGNDRIYGDRGSDRIDGGLGDDFLFGGFGADTIIGGSGNDVIETSGGLVNSFGEDGATDSVDAGSGNDRVSMGRNDTALGGSGIDALQVAGPDFNSNAFVSLNFSKVHQSTATAVGTGIYANTKAGQFEGGVSYFGFGVAGGSRVTGSIGDDTIDMEVTFSETSGATISGGSGNDRIGGSDKGDTIRGDSGDDQLQGDGGRDALTGGSGSDAFVFNIRFGVDNGDADTISDFNLRDDILAFAVAPTAANFGSESSLLLKGSNPTNATTAAGTAQFLYSTSTGLLSVDLNGSTAGGVVRLATLTNKANITANDILVEYDSINIV
jgi:Ca2+-binding RTX toxin-like protein